MRVKVYKRRDKNSQFHVCVFKIGWEAAGLIGYWAMTTVSAVERKCQLKMQSAGQEWSERASKQASQLKWQTREHHGWGNNRNRTIKYNWMAHKRFISSDTLHLWRHYCHRKQLAKIWTSLQSEKLFTQPLAAPNYPVSEKWLLNCK